MTEKRITLHLVEDIGLVQVKRMRPRSYRITVSYLQQLEDRLYSSSKLDSQQVYRQPRVLNVQDVPAVERLSTSRGVHLIDCIDGPVAQLYGLKIRSTKGRGSKTSHTGRNKRCERSEQRGDGQNRVCTRQELEQLSCVQANCSDWDSEGSEGPPAASQDEASEKESEIPARSRQSSGSWIQFAKSSKCPSDQNTASAQESTLKNNHGNGSTAAVEQTWLDSAFDIIQRVGTGGFGSVYKAKHKLLSQFRAIKEIQVKDLEKSLREVKVLSDLSHPHVLRYYSCWLQDTGVNSTVKSRSKFLFIEMELCEGGTLRRWIREKNRKSSENSRHRQGLEIAHQILDGVEYIHSKNLIHRDLKPENILFGQDEKVRIGDFGLVTQDDDEEKTEDKGTRSYMAPEQVGVNYDRKVDVFASGLIFFELFWRVATGHERAEVWADVRRQNLPPEFTWTYPLESHIIKSMLKRIPEARPEASALKLMLKKWTRRRKRNHDKEFCSV